MRKNSDPRITTKSIGVKNYLVILLVIFLICGCFTSIYFLQLYKGDGGGVYTILSILTYLIAVSFLIVFLLSFFYSKYIFNPVHTLSDAARRVAEGDYNIKIEKRRKDGKRDEFEVLFEDFNIMTEELASTELLKNDFISNVSHEMKTPLSIIQNYATLLQDVDINELERRDYARQIGEATKRMSVLITNILQMNRLENQKINIKYKPYNLSEQISRCVLDFEKLWEEKNINLDIDMDQDILISSDEELLYIVWNNLLSNAFKFTDIGGSIKITTRKQEDTIIVKIEDTGCGIAPQSINRIFDKFYQEDISHITVGNGLGLSLTKHIINMLKGNIQVKSFLNKGTIFTVSLKQNPVNKI